MNGQVAFLKELVEIHSGALQPQGILRVQDLLAQHLSALGFVIAREADPLGKHVPFLVATLEGSDPRSIDILTHADTVAPGMAETSSFTLSDCKNRAIGPGTLDDKGGQVIALEALERLVLSSKVGEKLPFTIRFISSSCEELGSPGFHPFLAELGRKSILTLGCEPSLDDGSIIDSRRGNRWYDISVKGRGGHSGRAHAQGINAGLELSHHLVELSRVTSYEDDITINIGAIHAGTDKFNVICDEAHAWVEARFSSLAGRDHVQSKIDRILGSPKVRAASDQGMPETHYKIVDDCPPFSVDPRTREFSALYIDIVEKLEGRRIQAVRAGGAADCCYMSRPGLLILDGFGPTGGKMHQSDEFVYVQSLETRAEALYRFLKIACEKLI